MIVRHLSAVILLLVPALAAGVAAPLVTELDKHSVNITASFTGDRILLFGGLSAALGGDVIVKVVSPEERISIERKQQTGPFWLTGHKHVVDGVPGVFYVLSNRPLDDILTREFQARYRLRLEDSLEELKATPPATHPDALRAAILRVKTRNGTFHSNGRAVRIEGERLFSTVITLPAKLPLGQYRIETFLVKNGEVLTTQDQHIQVDEVRLEHWFSNVVDSHPWTYGVFFTLAMMLFGLATGIVLSRTGGPKS